nr:hypothetical protein [Desulfobacterales bacterium]
MRKEVITSIILIETGLGTYFGKRLVINTLSTLAALNDRVNRDMIWNMYLKQKSNKSKAGFIDWATRKSSWAYEELKAYLKYVMKYGINPTTVYGSYAGAMGIAQFIPTNILRFARDGNQDGVIDLFDHGDAIESIANFLKEYGWRRDMTRVEAFHVLMNYNRSERYADAVLKIAERLDVL